MLRNCAADIRKLPGGDLPSEHGDDKAKFSLRSDPMLKSLFTDRSQFDFQIEIMSADDEIFFERREFASRRHFDQNRQGESFVHNCLPDIKDADIMAGKDRHQ